MGFALLWGTNIANYVFGSALVFWLGSLLFGERHPHARARSTSSGTTSGWPGSPMDEIRTQMEDFQKASAGIARMQELLDTEARLTGRATAALPAGPLAVEFDGRRLRL